jgi:hypothetical protein
MAGFIPAIHVGRHTVLVDVDGHDKPGHDNVTHFACISA